MEAVHKVTKDEVRFKYLTTISNAPVHKVTKDEEVKMGTQGA